jgi:hypothetical protein
VARALINFNFNFMSERKVLFLSEREKNFLYEVLFFLKENQEEEEERRVAGDILVRLI